MSKPRVLNMDALASLFKSPEAMQTLLEEMCRHPVTQLKLGPGKEDIFLVSHRATMEVIGRRAAAAKLNSETAPGQPSVTMHDNGGFTVNVSPEAYQEAVVSVLLGASAL